MTFYAGHKQTNAKTKLSKVQVFEVLALAKTVPYWFIAGLYGISYSLVYFIANGQRYVNLTKQVSQAKPHVKRRKVGLKLTKRKAENIRKLHKRGMGQNALARKYKVSQPVIFDIVKKRTFV